MHGIKFALQSSRRFAKQEAQHVDQMDTLVFQHRQACLNFTDLRRSLCGFEVRCHPVSEANLRERQALACDLRFRRNDGLLCLHPPQLDVIARRLAIADSNTPRRRSALACTDASADRISRRTRPQKTVPWKRRFPAARRYSHSCHPTRRRPRAHSGSNARADTTRSPAARAVSAPVMPRAAAPA